MKAVLFALWFIIIARHAVRNYPSIRQNQGLAWLLRP